MEKSKKYKIEVINFDVHKEEIIKLREQCWNDFHSKDLIKEEFYSQQDEIEEFGVNPLWNHRKQQVSGYSSPSINKFYKTITL